MIHWIIADISRSASKDHLSAKTGEPAWRLALEQKYARAGDFTLLSWPTAVKDEYLVQEPDQFREKVIVCCR
jgi:hypothetical protein